MTACTTFRMVSIPIDSVPAAPAEFHKRRFGLPGRVLVGTVGRMADVKNQLASCGGVHCAVETKAGSAARNRVGADRRRPVETSMSRQTCSGVAVGPRLCPGQSQRYSRPDVARSISSCCHRQQKACPTRFRRQWRLHSLSLPRTSAEMCKWCAQGVTGCVVPSRNIAAMSKAIEYYCDNPSIARQHGRAGRVFVENGVLS